jgi:hypothetical protein
MTTDCYEYYYADEDNEYDNYRPHGRRTRKTCQEIVPFSSWAIVGRPTRELESVLHSYYF